MFPVYIIHLDLHEIPMIFLMQIHENVEYFLLSMERETQITDASCLALSHEEIQQSVLYISFLENLVRKADGMEQIVVEIIRLQCRHGIVVHLQTSLARRVVEVRQFRRNVV